MEKDNITHLLNKYIFINNKLTAVSVILGFIWIIISFAFIGPNFRISTSDDINWLFRGSLVGLGGGIIFIIVGIIGKIAYRNKIIKCKNCGSENRADKYFCRNCGEKLDEDDLLKFNR